MEKLTIYDKIDLKLKQKNSNRKKMCLELNIPYSTLTSFYQKKSSNISLKTLKDIANYLNCSTDYLIKDVFDENLKTNLTEIEQEIFKICSTLTIKQKLELLNYAYKLEQEKNN